MKEKEEKVYDNYYCVIDGYIDTIVGPYPKMVFIPGRVLAIEYCALSCLLYDFETYLENYPDENGFFKNYGGAYILLYLGMRELVSQHWLNSLLPH